MKELMNLELQKKLLDDLKNYVIIIGVVQADSGRKDEVRVGINNAELMFIHENGSPLRNIPRRPVLHYSIEWAREQLSDVLDKCIEGIFEGWSKKDVEIHLKRFCIRLENYARDLIYERDPRLEPNKPGTISRKGSDLPLFDTGELARSISVSLKYE